jgi:hypothetical protein
VKKLAAEFSHKKGNRFSLDMVSRDMDKPRRLGFALFLRVRIYDGDVGKPKIRFSIPLPLIFCFSMGLDAFACLVLHLASVILPFVARRKKGLAFRRMMPLLRKMSRGFFLTRFSYALMRHGGRLGIRAIDEKSGVIIYGA